jgi:hypothetical protein
MPDNCHRADCQRICSIWIAAAAAEQHTLSGSRAVPARSDPSDEQHTCERDMTCL